MARLLIGAVTALVMLLAPAASAHKPSDSYLSLSVGARQVTGRWDIALRDLEHAIGLDRDGDGAITWGEVKARHTDIAAHALARLALRSAGAACATAPVEQLVDRHSDGAYAVLGFVADCPTPIGPLEITYDLLFDLDPLHRGLVQVGSGELAQTSIFSPERRTWRVQPGRPNLGQQFVTYLREGIWHIWIGIDHLLFLLCLLLPAAWRQRESSEEPGRHGAPVLGEIVKVVTAFTVAHSITLGLAALGVVELPSRLVESAIAASIVFAALNNVYPICTRRLWVVAFGFGLIHGFGFASVLADLALPQHTLVLALLGFNLGVEIGQLAVVGLFLSLCWALRRLDVVWPRWAAPLPAWAIGAIAALWFVERAFGVALAG
jgi:HupE / UreJ protein